MAGLTDRFMMEQGPVRTIDSTLLDELLRRARLSSRRRAIVCLHDGDWEHAHRMLNALAVGTYVRPHRHEDKHKGEGFIILRGKLALLILAGAGEIDFGQSRVLSVYEHGGHQWIISRERTTTILGGLHSLLLTSRRVIPSSASL